MGCRREPDLAEALSDPVIRAVMRADSVDPCELAALLRQVAGRVASEPCRTRKAETELRPW